MINGVSVNGVSVNGMSVNGMSVNGVSINGVAINGVAIRWTHWTRPTLVVKGRRGVLNATLWMLETNCR